MVGELVIAVGSLVGIFLLGLCVGFTDGATVGLPADGATVGVPVGLTSSVGWCVLVHAVGASLGIELG